jgi:hypothetical protein
MPLRAKATKPRVTYIVAGLRNNTRLITIRGINCQMCLYLDGNLVRWAA